MAVQIKVPELGESVVEATVGEWLKSVGDAVAIGDVLVELQTDKVDLEVNADVAGVLIQIDRAADEDVAIGDVLGLIEAADGSATPAAPAPSSQPLAPSNATPVAKRVAAVEGVDLSNVSGSGKGGKVTKADVQAAAVQPVIEAPAPMPIVVSAPAPSPQPPAPSPSGATALAEIFGNTEREERVKMSRRRRTIARNLVQAQQTAAMLTTFNEVDMHNVMELRKRRKVWFEEKFGTRLGFMSFFVKAVVAALKDLFAKKVEP